MTSKKARIEDLREALETLIDAYAGLLEHIEDIANGDQGGDDSPQGVGETLIKEKTKILQHGATVIADARHILDITHKHGDYTSVDPSEI